MNANGPLNLSRKDALNIERAILALEPFHKESWEDAVENYLILRWVLGLGPASVREIVDALIQANTGKILVHHWAVRCELPFNRL